MQNCTYLISWNISSSLAHGFKRPCSFSLPGWNRPLSFDTFHGLDVSCMYQHTGKPKSWWSFDGSHWTTPSQNGQNVEMSWPMPPKPQRVFVGPVFCKLLLPLCIEKKQVQMQIHNKRIPPGKDRWLATPMYWFFSWPLTNRHLWGVASHLLSLRCTIIFLTKPNKKHPLWRLAARVPGLEVSFQPGSFYMFQKT